MENLRCPFHITLPDAPQDYSIVTCHALIRALPGTRIVCRGTWKGQPVAVKMLFQRRHSKRHWLRQERGIAALIQRGIPVPMPLYSGRYTGNGTCPSDGYCIISTFIEQAKTLGEAWTGARTAEECESLIRSALACLAAMHEKGIVQQDLHFQNFLLHDSTFYLLDPDSIAIGKQPLGKKDSLANVALFFAQLPPQYDAWAPSLVERYAEMRGWKHIDAVPNFLLPAIRKNRSARVKKLLQKIFRESTAYVCFRNWGLYAVYRREMSGVNEGGLIRDPDAIISSDNRGNLKKGNTCTVTKTVVGELPVVVKRYNIKNFLHGVSRAFRKTRAAISWANAHRLTMLGIKTAAPLALVEKRIGPFRRESFYIASFVEGRNSKQYFADTGSLPEKSRVADTIVELFAALACHNISHGDMKATNILIDGGEAVLVDLDALRQHRLRWTFRRAFQKDMARFLRNWDDEPKIQELFRKKLSAISYQQSETKRTLSITNT